MKNCTTCKFMNFRCKGNCGDCVHKVADGYSNALTARTTPQSASRQLPVLPPSLCEGGGPIAVNGELLTTPPRLLT